MQFKNTLQKQIVFQSFMIENLSKGLLQLGFCFYLCLFCVLKTCVYLCDKKQILNTLLH